MLDALDIAVLQALHIGRIVLHISDLTLQSGLYGRCGSFGRVVHLLPLTDLTLNAFDRLGCRFVVKLHIGVVCLLGRGRSLLQLLRQFGSCLRELRRGFCVLLHSLGQPVKLVRQFAAGFGALINGIVHRLLLIAQPGGSFGIGVDSLVVAVQFAFQFGTACEVIIAEGRQFVINLSVPLIQRVVLLGQRVFLLSQVIERRTIGRQFHLNISLLL